MVFEVQYSISQEKCKCNHEKPELMEIQSNTIVLILETLLISLTVSLR